MYIRKDDVVEVVTGDDKGTRGKVLKVLRGRNQVVVEGETGWIETITSTYVVVRLWDLRRMVVPLSYFIEKPFQNWTCDSAITRVFESARSKIASGVIRPAAGWTFRYSIPRDSSAIQG